MRVGVTLRGELAGADESTQEWVELPDHATLEQLLVELGFVSQEVAAALVNGSTAARTTMLSDGDQVTLGG